MHFHPHGCSLRYWKESSKQFLELLRHSHSFPNDHPDLSMAPAAVTPITAVAAPPPPPHPMKPPSQEQQQHMVKYYYAIRHHFAWPSSPVWWDCHCCCWWWYWWWWCQEDVHGRPHSHKCRIMPPSDECAASESSACHCSAKYPRASPLLRFFARHP